MQSTCSSPTDCTDRAVVTWFKPQPITATVCYCQFYLWWGGGQREREGVRGGREGKGVREKEFFSQLFQTVLCSTLFDGTPCYLHGDL